jgi:hypothetical protein
MMTKKIKVYDYIGKEGRSRVNASRLGLKDIPQDEEIILDFSGVCFLSRSFTDEIVTLTEGYKYSMINTADIIQNMFTAVINGRKNGRKHKKDNSPIKRFTSLVELSQYLNFMV